MASVGKSMRSDYYRIELQKSPILQKRAKYLKNEFTNLPIKIEALSRKCYIDGKTVFNENSVMLATFCIVDFLEHHGEALDSNPNSASEVYTHVQKIIDWGKEVKELETMRGKGKNSYSALLKKSVPAVVGGSLAGLFSYGYFVGKKNRLMTTVAGAVAVAAAIVASSPSIPPSINEADFRQREKQLDGRIGVIVIETVKAIECFFSCEVAF